MEKARAFALEDAIEQAKDGSYGGQDVSDSSHLAFSTSPKRRLSSKDVEKIKTLVEYVELNYSVRLTLAGGGASKLEKNTKNNDKL